MSMRDVSKRGLLVLVALMGGAGCDFIVEAGQTLNLVNRMQVFGSGGNAQAAPLPSVRVQPGGTVVVQDADLFGGGTIVERVDQTRYGMAGSGIQAFGGTVRVQQGLVRGGPIVLNVDAATVDDPAPGILALSSVVEVIGGTVTGGTLSKFPGAAAPRVVPAPAIQAIGSVLTIRGGVLKSGGMNPSGNSPASDIRSDPTVVASGSVAEIRGGELNGGLSFVDSTVRMFGGHAVLLSLVSTAGSACAEIHGGSLSFATVQGGRLLVFGTGLRLLQDTFSGASSVTGLLEDGTSLALQIATRDGAQLMLLAPGSPGCP